MVEQLSVEKDVDVNRVCRVISVSRSGYYAWKKRPVSRRMLESEKLSREITEIHEMSRKTYGAPRVRDELKDRGQNVSRKKVAKVMKIAGIAGRTRKKFKVVTTDSNHALPIAERVFKAENHDVQVRRPNEFWGSDITYVSTKEGWLYLCVFLDLFTRKVVGFSMQDHMRSDLVVSALEMSLGRSPKLSGLTTHSDRGVQYAADDFRRELRRRNIRASMSRRGNCYDNAFVESFFSTLKMELVYRRDFKTRDEARQAIFEYIEVWYNRRRKHSALGFQSPINYEKQALAA
jgi:transposase InsO family protein